MKIKVFASNSVHGVCSALFPMFEQASGTGVEATFGAAKALLRQINEGERADLALLGSATIDELVQQGRIVGASVRPLASSGVGVGVKAGTPHPKIDTLDAFIAMLRTRGSFAGGLTERSPGHLKIPACFARYGPISACVNSSLFVLSGFAVL
jgi:molybdate transport system substrate-binding protein